MPGKKKKEVGSAPILELKQPLLDALPWMLWRRNNNNNYSIYQAQRRSAAMYYIYLCLLFYFARAPHLLFEVGFLLFFCFLLRSFCFCHCSLIFLLQTDHPQTKPNQPEIQTKQAASHIHWLDGERKGNTKRCSRCT